MSQCGSDEEDAAPSETLPGTAKSQAEREANEELELYEMSVRRISDLNEQGMTQGRTDIAEPVVERNPGLRNMEEYEDWVQNAQEFVTDRGRKHGGIVGEIIELEDIQKDVTTVQGDLKPCRHASILGGAGTGKTTLARRIARDGARGKHKRLKGKLIVLPDFRTFSTKEKLLPSQFLLGDIFPGKTEAGALSQKYEWMKKHQEKVVFIIDSLDTLPFDLKHERPRISYNQETTVDVLLHNLLAGDLFKRSDIISTSREYKVRNLHPSVRPDRCIILEGLSKKSSRDLIDGFLGEEKGKEMIEYIDTKCPDLWAMLSIPVCLVFSVIAFIQKGFKPTTMTGILIKFFLSLLTSPFARKKNFREIIRKLIPLSFEGIFHGRVLFTPENLESVGLTPEDVTDVGILIPQKSGTYLSTKLIQNERFYLYFNHQTQQECLAALHVLTMDLRQYEDFLKTEIHAPRFGVVRRIVCGVLLNDEVLAMVGELVKISDVEKRRQILFDSLGNAMKSHRGPDNNERLPDLLIALAEAGGGATKVIQSSLKRITLTNIPLSLSDAHAVGSIMKQCDFLSSVCLTGCNMNDDKLDAIVGPVLQSSLKVDEFHSSDSDLGTEGIKKLAKIVKHLHVKGLEIARCKLDSDRLQVFRSTASGMKLNRLDVSGNVGLKGKGMSRLGELILDFGVSNLKAEKCDLVQEDLQQFSQSSKNSMLAKLNVSGNKRLGPDGMFLLGELVRNRGVRELDASLCNPTPQALTRLDEGLAEAKFDVLNLRNMVRKLPYTSALLVLMRHVTKQINLQGWVIKEDQYQEIQNKLNEKPRTDLEIMLDEGMTNSAFMTADPCDSVISDIGALGGEVVMAGNKIEFLPNTFKDTSQIVASSSLGESHIPAKYFEISRVLQFNTSLKPDVGVKMKISIWASTDDPSIIVKSLCKKDGVEEEWKEMKSMPLREVRDRIVEIEPGEFNTFIVAIDKTALVTFKTVTFYAAGELSYDGHGNFEARFFADGRIIRGLEEQKGDRKIILLQNQRFDDGDLMQFNISCEPKNFSSLWGKKEFTVDRRFLTGSKVYHFKMTLKPLPDPKCDVIVMYNVKQNRKRIVKEKVGFSWPDIIPVSTEPPSVETRDRYQESQQGKTPTIQRPGGFYRDKLLVRGGGVLENCGCKVIFPPNALKEDKTIETTVCTTFPRRREDRFAVGPHFKCGPPGPLEKPVLIEMQLWMIPTRNDVYVEVYRQDGDDSDWNLMERVLVDESGKISFYTSHFTAFEVLADCAYWVWNKLTGSSVKVPLRNLAYINGLNETIAYVCHLDHEAVTKEVVGFLENSSYTPLLPQAEIAQACREMKVAISCLDPRDLALLPPFEQQGFREIEKVFRPIDIQTTKWEFYYVDLKRGNRGLGNGNTRLRFKYSLSADGVNREQPMQTLWPIPNTRQSSNFNIYGPVNAEGFYFG